MESVLGKREVGWPGGEKERTRRKIQAIKTKKNVLLAN
jgi:hypothetical protein